MPSHEEQEWLTDMADELFAVVADVKDYPTTLQRCARCCLWSLWQ